MVYIINSEQDSYTDLPLTLIFSVYTDFLTEKFGKIQIFFPLKLSEIQIFLLECQRFFSYTVLIHTYFFPKILIFLVIYTGFVSDHSGRSG